MGSVREVALKRWTSLKEGVLPKWTSLLFVVPILIQFNMWSQILVVLFAVAALSFAIPNTDDESASGPNPAAYYGYGGYGRGWGYGRGYYGRRGWYGRKRRSSDDSDDASGPNPAAYYSYGYGRGY